MSQRQSRFGAAITICAVIGISLFPVAYVLSIGPLVWFVEREYLDEENPALQVYAWPIQQVNTRSSVCAKMLSRYVLLWAPEESAYKYTPY